jgi:hypothetical protein
VRLVLNVALDFQLVVFQKGVGFADDDFQSDLQIAAAEVSPIFCQL